MICLLIFIVPDLFAFSSYTDDSEGFIMKKIHRTAFLLCAGRGERLRPLTHGMPKVLVPFLNLPLICYNWFHLEEMGVSRFFVNSHLFTENLGKFVESIRKPHQRIRIFHESQPLGSAGSLRCLKEHFQKEETFLYLNGDSLLFPSERKLLKSFTEGIEPVAAADKSARKKPLMGLFYATPFQEQESSQERVLWVDREHILRAICSRKEVKELRLKWRELRPMKFSGLALFSRDIFKYIKTQSFHIFDDVVIPLLTSGKFGVFIDEKGIVLEGGEQSAYLSSTEKALKALFSAKNSSFKQCLEDVFFRFDPKDRLIGLKRGRRLKTLFKMPILCPDSVKGMNYLSGKGFAVLGANVQFLGKSFLKNTVLGPDITWRGLLKEKLLFLQDRRS